MSSESIEASEYENVPKVDCLFTGGPLDGEIVRVPNTASLALFLRFGDQQAIVFGSTTQFSMPPLGQGQERAIYRLDTESSEPLFRCEQHDTGGQS